MKTKFVELRDTGTQMSCLVLQFEDTDKNFCKQAGFSPGLKIVLRFNGRAVSCIAGFELRDDYGGEISDLSFEMVPDGTIRAFKEMLHYVDDIRVLPDEVNVESWREDLISLKWSHFIPESLQDILEEFEHSALRKVAYRPKGLRMPHWAIINKEKNEVVFDTSSTETNLPRFIAPFLWIPIQTATTEELESVELTPFAYEIL
jgi:hypothetical protein